MREWVEAIMLALVLSDLALLASSRLAACIRIVAVQGVVVGCLPLVVSTHAFALQALLLAGATIALKGVVFPWLLRRALREAKVRLEVEPLVGYAFSVLVGLGALGLGLWVSAQLPLPWPVISPLVVPVSLATILVGLFAIISRVQALSQVLGYLVLENGIYAFGAALLLEQSILVELGILLDVFAAVFVMGIAIFHISRQFDHLDTQQLAQLGEWDEEGGDR